MRPRLVVLKLVAVAAVVAIVAAAPMAETASAHPARGRCVQVRASVLKSLRAGLRPTVRPQLGSAQAVEARGPFTLPLSFPGGVYFVSANLGRRGVATWVASGSFLSGAEGSIGRIRLFAMSKSARAVSDPRSGFGATILPQSDLAGWGLKPTTYGYTQSRRCVK
jgi:hypothetical protein